MKIGWLILLLGMGSVVTAQESDSALIGQLLVRISDQQVKNDGFYYAGMLPTLRSWSATPSNVKTDNSIFFTGLVVMTIRQTAPFLHGDERRLGDTIMARGIRAYIHYRNRKGGLSYNFWPTDRATFFPHSVLLDHLKDSKQIADDLDDTSIIDLGTGLEDSTARKLKALMAEHANGTSARVRNSYKPLKKLPVYSAWFGRKTPIELDAGVICNILYLVLDNGLPLNANDSASLAFLRYVLEKRKYMTDAAYASSYYPRSPVLIYHLSRLLGRFPLPGLDIYVPRLLQDIHTLLSRAVDPMDRVILGTALLRLGETKGLPDLPPGLTPTLTEQDPFVFYIANLSSLFPNPVRRFFLYSPLCIYYFYCPAYNDALLLEYLVLRRRANLPGLKSSIWSPSPSGH